MHQQDFSGRAPSLPAGRGQLKCSQAIESRRKNKRGRGHKWNRVQGRKGKRKEKWTERKEKEGKGVSDWRVFTYIAQFRTDNNWNASGVENQR